METRGYQKDLSFIGLLIILGVALYANTFLNQFVYDDLVTIQENLFIRDWGNLKQFFSRNYYLLSEEYSFRPLVTLTYFWDYFWWENNAWGYHLSNLLLHLLTGITVYFISKILFQHRFASKLVALGFMVHPVQAEAVNGISFREDLLCALFFLGSLLFYLKSLNLPRGPTRGNEAEVRSEAFPPRDRGGYLIYWALSLFSFALAFLSKEMAVSLPLIIALFELLIRRQPVKKLLSPLILSFFALDFAYGFGRLWILYNRESLPAAPEFGDIFTRIFLVFKGWGLYGRLLFFPLNLTVEYPDPFPPVAWSAYLMLFTLLMLAFTLTAWIKARSSKIERFGLGFLCLGLLPILNIIPSSRLGAERFLYLPSFGFFLWGASVISPGARAYPGLKRRSLALAGVALVTIFWGAGTISRNRDWRNNLVLFSRAVETSPQSSKAHHGLGNEYFRRGRLPAAVAELKKAEAIFPREPFYYNSLGVAYGELGRFEEALLQFQNSIRLNPYDPLVLINLSTLYLRMNDPERAEKEIQNYIRLRPHDPRGYINLGEIYLKKDDCPAAIKVYHHALELDSHSLPALLGLGYCYFKTGDQEKAEQYWEKGLTLDPRNQELRHNLKILRREFRTKNPPVPRNHRSRPQE